MEHGEGGRHRHRTRASRSFDPPGPASNRAGNRPAASPVSLLDQAPHRSVRYRKGRLIFEEGDAPTAVFRVDRGCVRLRVCGLDGHRQIVAFLFPGDFLGVGLEAHACGAEAVTDVDLTCYPLQGVRHLSKQSPDVALELLGSADAAFKQLVHHVHLITHLSAHERVLWFLGWLSCRQRRLPGDEVVLPMSHRDVGDFLALSPETLSRVLRGLRADGRVISQERRSFSLHPSGAHPGAESLRRSPGLNRVG